MDFSGIFSGISAASIVTSVLAAAALIAYVGFSQWATRMIGTFYDTAKELKHGAEWVACDDCGDQIHGDEDVYYTQEGDILCWGCREDRNADKDDR